MHLLRAILALSVLMAQSTYASNTNSPIIYCPKPSELIKKAGKWESNTKIRWLSYETSFADDVTVFLGAQWQGVAVGPMSCIYQSSNTNVFPITLQNDHMFKIPTQANWTAGQDNMVNCVSNNVEDCPLTPKVKEENSGNTQQIFQQIDANTS